MPSQLLVLCNGGDKILLYFRNQWESVGGAEDRLRSFNRPRSIAVKPSDSNQVINPVRKPQKMSFGQICDSSQFHPTSLCSGCYYLCCVYNHSCDRGNGSTKSSLKSLSWCQVKLDEGDSAAVVQLIVPIVNIPTTQLHPAYTPAVELLELEIGPNLTNNWFYPPTSGGQKFH